MIVSLIQVSTVCFCFSIQLEQSYKSENGIDREREEQNRNLVAQNVDLRRKIEEEHASYKRKLQAYQDGQQRQAQLVQKLQAKVKRPS